MKKIITAFASLALLTGSLYAIDLSVRIIPEYNILLDSMINSTMGVSGSVDFSPLNPRNKDDLYFGLQGTYFPLKANGLPDSMAASEGALALGYNFRPVDRLTISAEGLVGLWNVPSTVEDIPAGSGVSFGGRLGAYFNVIPELSAGLCGGYKYYWDGEGAFLSDLNIGVSLRYSFTRGVLGKSKVKESTYALDPIFPVFYSRYDDHKFGTIVYKNEEPNDITDVEVSVFIEQYMTNPKICSRIPRVKSGEEFSADLTAFFSENILNNLRSVNADAKVTVKYKSLGKVMTFDQFHEITTFGRNNMNWEDDRRAAAFISSHDGTASNFANYVKTAVRDNLNPKIPYNIQMAAAMFSALKKYQIRYVKDPSGSFTNMAETSDVDSLNFPYQTLMYKGGDCDDLSILNCALLESIGIDTAIITVPGHIFIAFDTGVPVKDAASVGKRYIVNGDRVWIPLEITLCEDSFNDEIKVGMAEWNKYPEERLFIQIRNDAWKEYNAVGIPDSSVKIKLPAKSEILKEFLNISY